MSDIVNKLLTKTQFAQLPYEDKLQIVKIGRPQPSLIELKSEHKEKNRVYTRCFSEANYKKYPWLTGSSTTNKLYCWACLLFCTDTSPWNKTGFNNLNYLVTACDKHQKSLSHIRAFNTLQTFGFQRIDHSLNLQKKIADSLHNEKVKENRIILRRLIDAVIFLGKQECPFRGHNESSYSTNKGMYIELLEFLSTYEQTIANHLKTATIFRGTSPVIQNDLIDAVGSVITDKIKSEISNATFVAILLDETTDITNKSQLSTVLRFVDNEGNCQERFLHFTDVSLDRTAQGLFQHVTKVVDDLECSKKLIAQTFDGAAVMAGHVSGLQTLVKNKYPSATFIHCCSHRLNLVLSKSTNFVAECKRFFITLSGIPSFFSHSTVRTTALKNFMEKKLPRVVPTRWNFSSRLVNTVKEYRRPLIMFFSSIEDEPGDWTGEEVNTASGFVCFLLKFDTRFLLLSFSKIFAISDVLFDIMQKKCLDISYCMNKVNEFYDTLQKIRDEDFDLVWTEATSNSEYEDKEPRHKRQRNEDRSKWQRIFNEILDTVMSQIKFRFESQKDLKFVSLLDSNNFDTFCKSFPQNLMTELKEPYSSYFDIVRLKNELNVLYTLDEYKKKSVNEITIYMKLNNLDIVFSEVYKLAELTLTFTSTTATVERSFSALKRIKTYLRATQGQVRLSNLAVISIEKNILLNMKKWSEETFYESVILKFTQKERRMEFLFK